MSSTPPPADDQAIKAFLRIVGTGQLDEIRRILAASPQVVNAIGPHPFWGGRSQPLHVAIETNRREVFDTLLEAGADVNGVNDHYDHWSPLMIAVNQDRGYMRDELMRRAARVGLIEALLLADDTRVETLLAGGAKALPALVPNAGSVLNFARTPLAIDRLIALGASPDAKDRWGTTPIAAMSRLGSRGLPLVRHLIAHGATATPADYARLGDQQTLAAMTDSNPDVARSEAVMMGAVELGHQQLVEWLVARGASVNARADAPSRHTALHAASWNGDLPMVKLLVGAGADIRARDEQHHATPRDWAETAIQIRNNPACAEVAEYLAGV